GSGWKPPFRCLVSSKSPERGSHLCGEDVRLLPGGEMAAPLGFVEIGDVRIRLLDPAARGGEDLAGERREADRSRHRWRSLTRSERLGLGLRALPVRAGR